MQPHHPGDDLHFGNARPPVVTKPKNKSEATSRGSLAPTHSASECIALPNAGQPGMDTFFKISGENSQRHSSPYEMKNASRTRRAIVDTQIESDASNHAVLNVAPHTIKTNFGSIPPRSTSRLNTGRLTPRRTVT